MNNSDLHLTFDELLLDILAGCLCHDNVNGRVLFLELRQKIWKNIHGLHSRKTELNNTPVRILKIKQFFLHCLLLRQRFLCKFQKAFAFRRQLHSVGLPEKDQHAKLLLHLLDALA